jgi:eukaryotic-like serine/threonine-protein kinase
VERNDAALTLGGEPFAGQEIAGRYRILESLGRGGQGEVFTAHDALSGEVVALKLVGGAAARIRREVAALRLLRLPGVVRFIDEGVEAGQTFLVMEHLAGRPFPGRPVPCAWSDLSSTTIGLLEALGRVHAAGVVHRDLKPANVLVDERGQATILDFGLSYNEAPQQAPLTLDTEILGTPAYLAPEQINGDPTTPQADLYALGVMLYEALSGLLPHVARDTKALMRARLLRRPAPLKSVAPQVPSGIAELVDALLETEARDRPRSAAEVLCLLQGQPSYVIQEPPWLGSRAPIDTLVEAARTRTSKHLTGPAGAGRSRCLREANAELKALGHRIVWLVAGSHAFSALKPLLGASLGESQELGLEQFEATAEAALRRSLEAGDVLVVDDLDQLDRSSARLLERCRGVGVVLSAGLGNELLPLREEELRPLFVGPDRLLHLREDSARVLYVRTEGLPARVFAELEAWERSGLARRDGARWSLTREAIERLEAGPLSLRVEQLAPPLPSHLEELLGWIELAGLHADAAQLSRAMEQPRWRVEAAVQELREMGLVYTNARGLGLRAGSSLPWSPEQRQAAHRALARVLPTGAPGRLRSLVLGAPEDDAPAKAELATEATTLAEGFTRDGRLGLAVQALNDGIRAIRGAPENHEALDSLLACWVEVAFLQGTPQALDRVLYELCRSARSPLRELLEALVRATLAVGVWSARALALVEAIAPFTDPVLERRRQGVRVLAARRCSLAQEEATLQEVGRWVAASQDPGAALLYAAWLGRLRYRQGRFDEAVSLQAQAAEATPLPEKLSALLNGASALLEAYRFSEAAEWARSALLLARDCRHTYFEGRAEWLLRSAAYRNGEALAPDRELAEAAKAVPVPEVEGLIGMTEAAISWRSGDVTLAREMSQHTRAFLTAAGEPLIVLLVEGLEVACGAVRSEPELAALAERACQKAPPEVALQVLGLLALGGITQDPAVIHTLTEKFPRKWWGVRMEVLSIEEVLSAVQEGVKAIYP